jgi:hypothetical protein
MDVLRVCSKDVGCGLSSTDSEWSPVVDTYGHGEELSISIIFSRSVLFFRVSYVLQ